MLKVPEPDPGTLSIVISSEVEKSDKAYSAVAASSFLRKENITRPEMTQSAMRTVQLTQSGTLSQSIDGMELR